MRLRAEAFEAIVLACRYCDLTTYWPKSWGARQLVGYELSVSMARRAPVRALWLPGFRPVLARHLSRWMTSFRGWTSSVGGHVLRPRSSTRCGRATMRTFRSATGSCLLYTSPSPRDRT